MSVVDQRAELLLDRETAVPDAIVAALADMGIEYVIGIPGGGVGRIFSALHGHSTISAVLVREESLASYMAEAYGRLRGRPAVVMGQGEWIVGNAGQGSLESLLGSSPMVVLTDLTDGGVFSHHGFYQSGSGDYGAWDARKALEGVTKRVMVSRHPAQAVQHVQLAVKHAMTGEPGPVAVAFSTTALRGTVDPAAAPRLYRSRGYLHAAPVTPDVDQLARVAAQLAGAERPVIVAGNGVRVSQACESLCRVAEAFDVPVVTTAHGKGVLPETHPLAAGVIGSFGWPSANDVLADSDFVLAIGTKLATIDTIDESTSLLDPTRQVLVQVDVEPLNAGWTTPIADAVVSDADAFLRSLTPDADSVARSRTMTGASRVTDAIDAAARADSSPSLDGPPFAPQAVIDVLNDSVPDDTVIACDAGENRLFMMRWYRSTRPGGYLQPAAGGGMGHAVPAAMGAKLAHPEATAIAVCGDGGFAMSLHGLMTAIEQRLPIGVVVLDNGALGWVLHGMGERAIASTFAGFDYAAIARAIGCEGHEVETLEELRAAIERIEHANVPVVISVPTSLETSFRDILDPLDQRRSATGY
jgi:acetolactate synthase-1/2/3 large subunit